MRYIIWLFVMGLLGCAEVAAPEFETSTRDIVVERELVTQLRTELRSWPTCGTQASPQVVAIVLSTPYRWCMTKTCAPGVCCNTCGWIAPAALHLPSSGLDCDRDALNTFLGTVLIDADARCVVW